MNIASIVGPFNPKLHGYQVKAIVDQIKLSDFIEVYIFDKAIKIIEAPSSNTTTQVLVNNNLTEGILIYVYISHVIWGRNILQQYQNSRMNNTPEYNWTYPECRNKENM